MWTFVPIEELFYHRVVGSLSLAAKGLTTHDPHPLGRGISIGYYILRIGRAGVVRTGRIACWLCWLRRFELIATVRYDGPTGVPQGLPYAI